MPDIQQRLNCLLQLAIQQARAADIPVSSRISPSVQLNCRAKTRLGCCRATREGHTIEVSAALGEADDRNLIQVLAHEVLHTCPGCANHGPRWRYWAERMNRAYGYHIQRTGSYQALGLSDPRPVRYLVVCSRCGREIPRMKRSSLVDHPERYRCRCGGILQVLPQTPES